MSEVWRQPELCPEISGLKCQFIGLKTRRISQFSHYQRMLQESEPHVHTPAIFSHIPAELGVHTWRKARRVRTARPSSEISAIRAQHTCRAFHRIFRDSLVHHVGMRYLMHSYPFQTENLHASNV